MTSYIKGDYNAICDRCGYKRKASDMRPQWNNLFVCVDTCWEPRHPQDFVRGKKDKQRVPVPRPESTDKFYTPITGDDL